MLAAFCKFIDGFFDGQTWWDMVGTGAQHVDDGVFDNDDILAFVSFFFARAF